MQRVTPSSDAADFYDALQDLLRAYQFRDRDAICRFGISVTACYALEAVVREGPLTVAELAERLRLDKSTASRTASALEQAGYVARTDHATDGRSIWLAATRSGEKLHERIRASLIEKQAPLLADFDADTRRRIVALVRKLAEGAR